MNYLIKAIDQYGQEITIGAFYAGGDAYESFNTLRNNRPSFKSITVVKKSGTREVILFHHDNECSLTNAVLDNQGESEWTQMRAG